ncbi:hypothetical protein PoB_003953900 [Plakobranchus ocellatus]|uniref:Uncharacterized protein n=1 Tax=Plakobranchus ocellatus TaxID=259542 RepID=A0AAV4B3U0_9GAST|nr:hypothetical protein PoB_003953900 [Plakobranchus ocellatus]
MGLEGRQSAQTQDVPARGLVGVRKEDNGNMQEAPKRGLMRVGIDNHNRGVPSTSCLACVDVKIVRHDDVGDTAIDAEPIRMDQPVFLGCIAPQLQGQGPACKTGSMETSGPVVENVRILSLDPATDENSHKRSSLRVGKAIHFAAPGANTQKIENYWKNAKRRFKQMSGTLDSMLPSNLDEFMWDGRSLSEAIRPRKMHIHTSAERLKDQIHYHNLILGIKGLRLTGTKQIATYLKQFLTTGSTNKISSPPRKRQRLMLHSSSNSYTFPEKP